MRILKLLLFILLPLVSPTFAEQGLITLFSNLPNYNINTTIPTNVGTKSKFISACEQGTWQNESFTYCKPTTQHMAAFYDAELTKIAPKINQAEIQFDLIPKNITYDPFVDRVLTSLVTTGYVDKEGLTAYLVSANKTQVLGILIACENEAFCLINFVQAPCKDWNHLVQARYNNQAISPGCW